MEALIDCRAIAGLTLGRNVQGLIQELYLASVCLSLIALAQRIRHIQQRVQSGCLADCQVPKMGTERRDEELCIETLGQHFVESEHSRSVVSLQEGIQKPERILAVEDIEITDDVLIFDVRTAECDCLVENGERITHRTVSLLGDYVQGRIVHIDSLLLGNVPEIAHYVADRYAVEVVGLAA